MTLTFIQPVSDKKAMRCLTAYFDNWKKRGYACNYVAVMERQENGNPHWHILITRYVDIDEENLRWTRIQYNNGKVAVSIPASELSAIENIEKKSPLLLPEIGINGGMRLGPLTLTVNVCGIFPRTDNLNFVRLNSCLFAGLELKKGMFKRKNKTEEAPAN